MPFDAGARSYPPAPSPSRWTSEDWLDLVLRILVLVPLAALYGWWVFDVLRVALSALLGIDL